MDYGNKPRYIVSWVMVCPGSEEDGKVFTYPAKTWANATRMMLNLIRNGDVNISVSLA